MGPLASQTVFRHEEGERDWAEIVEKRQARPMNYVIMSPDDFLYRRSVRDRFIGEVFEMEISETYDPDGLLNKK